MGKPLQNNVELEAIVVTEKSKRKRTKKKRASSELESEKTEKFLNNEPIDGVQTDDDLNEPTMGEKLVILDRENNEKGRSLEKARAKRPSLNSVHVLLKQALHADDRALLLDCLNRCDERVVSNSVSQLSPSDVFKLLDSLISIVHSRGAVLVCAIQWLRSLLLQHLSSIISQESSLLALNSLNELIKSRNSSLSEALELLSGIDMIYSGTVEDEDGSMEPIIYVDYDSDEEEAMETDEEYNVEVEAISDVSDFEAVLA